MNVKNNKLYSFITGKLGIDGAIAYSSGSRIIGAFTGILNIFFITSFLTGVEQGFFYTFWSILSIQVFFELGLTSIITQFVAHEAAHLKIDGGIFVGDDKYKSRLGFLLHFCVKWYAIISILFFITIIIVGFVFFTTYGKDSDDVNWQIPWMLVCVSAFIKLFQSPLNSFVSGLGFVKEMSIVGFWQQMILPLFTWIGLALGIKLYVLGISTILSALIWYIYVYKTSILGLLTNLWRTKISERVSYTKEIFPYQWRIAMSWISGYFIFQCFNPVLFVTEGAVVAGRMGMTMSILNQIQTFSMSWINTKVPRMSGLIALKDYCSLDRLFDTTQKQMIGVCLFLVCAMFVGLWVLDFTQFKIGNNVLSDRFLDFLPLLLMTLPLIRNIYVFSWATYLRCHKKEPYLKNSVVTAVLCIISFLTIGRHYGLYGIVGGYCAIQLALTPWSYRVYKDKKRLFHENK